MKKHLIAVFATLAVVTVLYCFHGSSLREDKPAAHLTETTDSHEQRRAPASSQGISALPEQEELVEAAVQSSATVPAPSTPPNLAKISAFTDWSKRWMSVPPAEREPMREEGLRLATERRPEFKKL